MNRPQFQRLLADVRAGKIDVVPCTKFDRISELSRLSGTPRTTISIGIGCRARAGRGLGEV